MPKYEAKEYLSHNGAIVQPGEIIELTEEQAKLEGLKGKVEVTEKATLADKTVPELKKTAKEKGIEGYSTMDKEALIEAVKEE